MTEIADVACSQTMSWSPGYCHSVALQPEDHDPSKTLTRPFRDWLCKQHIEHKLKMSESRALGILVSSTTVCVLWDNMALWMWHHTHLPEYAGTLWRWSDSLIRWFMGSSQMWPAASSQANFLPSRPQDIIPNILSSCPPKSQVSPPIHRWHIKLRLLQATSSGHTHIYPSAHWPVWRISTRLAKVTHPRRRSFARPSS